MESGLLSGETELLIQNENTCNMQKQMQCSEIYKMTAIYWIDLIEYNSWFIGL